MDILLSGGMEERACVVAEYGKEVRKIEQRISEFTASHPAAAMSAAEALAPEQSVDEVRESLSVTEKGQPANTIGNCRTCLLYTSVRRVSRHPFAHRKTAVQVSPYGGSRFICRTSRCVCRDVYKRQRKS